VWLWHGLARRLRQIFERVASTDKILDPSPHGHLGIYLLPGKDNRPVLALQPDNLENALKLYAARMIADGTTLNHCKNCQNPFLSGGGRERRKKRGDATFCSDDCRWKFHNEARRKARMGG